MENSVLLPTMAQKRSSGFNQYAEDATIISEETTKAQKVNHFIEANTMEIDLQHLKSDCIVPVFSKDNELTISHNAFIETVWEAEAGGGHGALPFSFSFCQVKGRAC